MRGFASARLAADRSLERLSTGQRINRAADDPAGLVASLGMRSDLSIIEKKLEGFEREKSSLGIQEGGLTVQGELLQDLLGHVISAANGAGISDTEREAFQLGVNAILDGIDSIAAGTTFNGKSLLAGFQAGKLGESRLVIEPEPEPEPEPSDSDPDLDPNSGQDAEPEVVDIDLADLRSGGLLDLGSGNLEAAERVVRGAIDEVAGRRGAIGARMIQIDAEAGAIRSEYENVSAAVSEIVDTDYAKETADRIRASILAEASLSSIMIGRQSAESVLALLDTAAGPLPG